MDTQVNLDPSTPTPIGSCTPSASENAAACTSSADTATDSAENAGGAVVRSGFIYGEEVIWSSENPEYGSH